MGGIREHRNRQVFEGHMEKAVSKNRHKWSWTLG